MAHVRLVAGHTVALDLLLRPADFFLAHLRPKAGHDRLDDRFVHGAEVEGDFVRPAIDAVWPRVVTGDAHADVAMELRSAQADAVAVSR